MKAKIATATIPGRLTGSRIRNSAPSGVAPSTIAASSSSRGIALKYPASIQIENGSENVR